MPLKALVLGASGHLGNAVTRELLRRGYRVTAVSRRKKRSPNLSGLPLSYLTGDVDEPGRLQSWARGQDIVVDAAAPYSMPLFAGAAPDEIDHLRHAHERTEVLLDAVRKNRSRLVFVSSFTTVRHRAAAPAWEGALARAIHPYFAVKELMESRIVDEAKKGLPAVIVNPTMCLGPWECRDRTLCFIPQLLSGEITMGLRHTLNVIDVRDAANGIVAALELERYGDPTLLCGRNISIDALCTWVCEIGGVKPPRFYIPTAISILGLSATDYSLGLFGLGTTPASLAVMLASAHDWLTPTPLQRELGVHLRPLSETLLDAIEWHRRIGNC